MFLVLYAIGMLGIACFNTLCWAMITDVIDEDEVRNGERSDGTMYSVYSFARKLGQALSSGLVGAAISAIGYDVNVYDQGVADALYNCTTIVPAIGFAVLALALIFLYPLSKKKVRQELRHPCRTACGRPQECIISFHKDRPPAILFS